MWLHLGRSKDGHAKAKKRTQKKAKQTQKKGKKITYWLRRGDHMSFSRTGGELAWKPWRGSLCALDHRIGP